MRLSDLRKIEKRKYSRITTGFGITALLTSVPLLMSSLASVVGFFKVTFSTNGEIKDKLTTFKWDNSKKQDLSDSKFNIY
ncbi:hypothetical protein MCANUF31_01461 [Mycoplasmopsis canis UF31]|uniref:Uncharacterized protein n=1 Tax=Mycoplasmopsis canis TaxID=29555 RepID=A0A449AR79_9BACT|nr:hypothetical protein [Mycoplasmopsis canis]AMD81224.1 hypothetical protein AXW82_01465 [Mycoplasmopsis canis PG 14]EIE39712.1 hypothetical protein MCANPG14_01501 [Mycoplasmopsis canis PG 14]EIE39927.1 hypothetical protein MCANUF31_01461 [Mycoplasmopsis canis UF31]VEU69048.1 Uncharacterised protein [Mycoplasmopsis canis]